MRVLVTGAGGFVGRWMAAELTAAGHEVLAAPGHADLDIADREGVGSMVAAARPDGVVHLAGVAYGPDAARDPSEAGRVNVTGTRTLLDACADSAPRASVLVAGSSEVYGNPDPADLPLRENAPVRPSSPYGRSKAGQERVALDAGREAGLAVVVTRSFNHTGPGQRAEFVAPALANRILRARDEGAAEIAVGNIDVRRDISDVRDVVRAYRLLLEGLHAGRIPSSTVVNVATGRSVSVREVIALLSEIIGVQVAPTVDPQLVRAIDPPEIVGEASLLRSLADWEPTIPLRQTLEDLVASITASR
jgi:GDP-4-dehydro-6-deoxy-D-mannose reductase